MWWVNLLAAFGAVCLITGLAIWAVAWILQKNIEDM